jgi:hypothetical protein
MVRKADPAQRFSADIVDGAPPPGGGLGGGLLSTCAGYDKWGARRLNRGR